MPVCERPEGRSTTMQNITLRVISGSDRGQIFRELATPITIGREEGNDVQLNDERISRYHVKIQEDKGRLVITDLESTNGTRINGHVCNLKILRTGDTISVGRTVLLFGSRQQVEDWLQNERENSDDSSSGQYSDSQDSTGLAHQPSSHRSSRNIPLPQGLTPGQSAELREILDHLHEGISSVLDNATVNEKENQAAIDVRSWQHLLLTQSEISEFIRAIEDPQSSDQHNFDL